MFKKILKKRSTKIIASVLALSLAIGGVLTTKNIRSNADSCENEEDINNTNLTLTDYNFDNFENESEIVTITADNGEKVIAKIIDNNVVFSKYNSYNEIISSEDIALSAFDVKDVDNENYEEFPVRDDSNKWDKLTKDKYKDNYWYRYGRKEDNHLLNIGKASASLIIDMNNLSFAEIEKCKNYTNSIDKCNKKMTEAKALNICSAAILSGVLIVIKACEIASGNKLSLIKIISSIPGVTGGTAIIKEFIEKILKVDEYYTDIEDAYVDIISYAQQ